MEEVVLADGGEVEVRLRGICVAHALFPEGAGAVSRTIVTLKDAEAVDTCVPDGSHWHRILAALSTARRPRRDADPLAKVILTVVAPQGPSGPREASCSLQMHPLRLYLDHNVLMLAQRFARHVAPGAAGQPAQGSETGAPGEDTPPGSLRGGAGAELAGGETEEASTDAWGPSGEAFASDSEGGGEDGEGEGAEGDDLSVDVTRALFGPFDVDAAAAGTAGPPGGVAAAGSLRAEIACGGGRPRGAEALGEAVERALEAGALAMEERAGRREKAGRGAPRGAGEDGMGVGGAWSDGSSEDGRSEIGRGADDALAVGAGSEQGKATAGPSRDGGGIFLQKLTVSETRVRLDWRPRRLDVAALGRGHLAELLNAVPLEEAEVTLKSVEMTAMDAGEAAAAVAAVWARDIASRQSHRLLRSLPAFRSVHR